MLAEGQPPEPGELFLLPLDRSWRFPVGKSPASPQGSSRGGVSVKSQSGPRSFPKLTQALWGGSGWGFPWKRADTAPGCPEQGWELGAAPTPCPPPRSDSGTPSLGQGSARSSARPRRSGRLWKRSSQVLGLTGKGVRTGGSKAGGVIWGGGGGQFLFPLFPTGSFSWNRG